MVERDWHGTPNFHWQHTCTYDQKPKILGVTLDPTLPFKYHVKNICDKLNKKKKKSLAGSSWGREKEVLTTTNKAIGRSLLTYGAPIWTLGLSTTHWQTLQAGQNAALRTTRLRPPTRATTTTTTCAQADNLFKPLLCSLVSPELKAGESFFQWFHGILKYEGALQAWQANRHLSSEKCSAT